VNRRRALSRGLECAFITALGLIAAGCGVPEEGKAHRLDPDSVPFALLDPAPTTTTTEPPPATATTRLTTRVTLYLVRSDRIVAVDREVPAPISARDIVGLLAQALTPAETSAGYRSALVPGRSVAGVTSAGGIASVDLTPAFTETAARDQTLALAQITYTLTALPGLGQVSFTLNGVAVDVAGGEGSIVHGPVSRDTYRTLVG
jgi:spore germination protein GerM